MLALFCSKRSLLDCSHGLCDMHQSVFSIMVVNAYTMSVQFITVVVVMHNHLSHDYAPQRIARCGKIRTA
jgi:hypothetical protein